MTDGTNGRQRQRQRYGLRKRERERERAGNLKAIGGAWVQQHNEQLRGRQ